MVSIFEKVQKLLALAGSENPHEARLASEKAQELLLKYNLSMSDVEINENPVEDVVVGDHARAACEVKYAADIVQRFFFVNIVWGRRKGRTVLTMYGRRENMKIAAYVYDFLLRAMKDSFKLSGQSSRQSFCVGFHKAMCEKLEAARSTVVSGSGLVLKKDYGIDSYIREKVGSVRRTTSRSSVRDREAMNEGIRAGQNTNIRTAVNSNSNSSVRYLGGK